MSIYNGYGKTRIEIYDYLNGDGYSFINTNYLLKSSDTIKFKVNIISGFTKYRYVFGAMTTSQSKSIDIRNDTAVYKLRCFIDGNPLNDIDTNTVINLSDVVYGIFEITISSSSISCNNTEFSHNRSLPDTEYPLFIFRKNKDNDDNDILSPICNFAYFEITNKLSLRPCKLKGTLPASYTWDNQAHYANECGMWDSVNKKFYGNVNLNGVFSVSGDKIDEFEIVENEIKYIAIAEDSNTVVYPKKVYFANSSNSVQLVYIRPVKELHIVNPSFYQRFRTYVTDISEIRLTSHIPNAAEVVDNNIVNITHNNNNRFVKTYMWLTEDTNNTGKYIGHIGSPWYDDENSKFYCHGIMTVCFTNLKVTSLQHFVSRLDTSNVTNMQSMFFNCPNLTSLDLSNFDTSNVTYMQNMFSNCPNLTSLDLSSFNTSNVTNMQSMFSNCPNLTSLDLSSFNTGGVTDMSSMFSRCSSLTSLDLSNFDTSNVTDMQYMFNRFGADSFNILDLSNFDTSKVNNFSCMFAIAKVKQLFIDFNTSNGIDLNRMFGYMPNVKKISSTTLDLTSMENDIYMFDEDYNLVGGNGTTYIWVGSNWSNRARIDGENGRPGYFTSPDYIEITNPSFLIKFPNYVSDSSDNLSALRYTNVIPNASEVVDNRIIEITAERSGARTFMWLEEDTVNTGKYIGYIGCKKYTNNCTIYVSGSMGHCFRGIKLTNIQNIIEQLDTSKVTNMSYCFYGCRNLQVLDLSNWNTSNVTNMEHMFRYCSSLTSLDLSNFDTSNVTNMSHMFFECSGLLSLDVSNFNTSSVTNMIAIFANVGIAGMKSFNCSNFNTSNVTDMTYMFYYMTKVEKIICNTLDLTSLEADKDYWMFKFDRYLVGGNGTTFNDSYVDSTYARVDGENGLPGYFTDPANQSKITLMNSKNDGLKYLDYITINSTYTIPTLQGYTAVVTDNNGNTYTDGDTITINQDITLTFVWSAVNNN